MSEGIHTTLAQAQAWLGAALHGHGGEFRGVGSDSRTIGPGMLFVALVGERHDGHDHVEAARARGAAAALVSRLVASDLPQLLVSDTRLALGRLGAAWRHHLNLPLAAVTGSNGKTTVKEMTAAILGRMGPVLATRGNLNNDIGVPLTLLRLDEHHRTGVIEMGANHPGEIDYLAELTRPNVAVVTNAGPAHLEGFGSVEGVARAKGEIFQGLAENGVAVINADDAFADLWLGLAAGVRTCTFGLDSDADLTAEWEPLPEGSRVTLHGDLELTLDLPLPGRHNVLNCLAATAVALQLGAGADAVRSGLEALQPVSGRLTPRTGRNGARIIDDAYNANPASVGAALEVLAARHGRRLLALGDMGELGEGAAELHRGIGARARELGIDGLYAVGKLSAGAVSAFGGGARLFIDQSALIDGLAAELAPDVTVLVKGSRSARMERVVAGLVDGEY